MNIGKSLKELREAKKLSMREAAKRVRVSRQTIFRSEHDDISNLQLLLKLINVYRVKGPTRMKLLGEYLRANGLPKASARLYAVTGMA